MFLGTMAAWAVASVITKKAKANTFQINYILGLVFVMLGGVAYPYLEHKSNAWDLFMCALMTGWDWVGFFWGVEDCV